MRAVTIDSDLATLFTFTPRKPPITPILEVPRERSHHPRRFHCDTTDNSHCLAAWGVPVRLAAKWRSRR